jgi:NADH-quinone oxidoreductase subunit E
MFSSELRTKAEELIGRYPGARSALLPLLHLVQHNDGYISDDGIAECAELLGLTKAEVGAVATFYTMYKREPMGRHLVSVCTNFSCKVRGSQDVYDALAAKLGVGHNGTTPDAAVTLEHAECLGNCEGAPVVSVDYLNYEALDVEQATALVDALIARSAHVAGGGSASDVDVPPPTRGYVPPGIRDVQHRLAGLGSVGGIAVGTPTDQARAADGAVPVPDAGPGGDQVTIDVAQAAEREGAPRDDADAREDDRQEAREAVREVGKDPDDLADQAAYSAREFPTAKPDGEADEPGTDVRDEDQVPTSDADRAEQIVEPEESVAEDRRQQAGDGDADRPGEGS